MSTSIQTCNDTSESIELCEARGFYLKPMARLNVSVQLPLLKSPGKSISNWEVIERLKKLVRPCEFTSLKVSKTSLEFIRFEAELENKTLLRQAVSRMDGNTIKLGGFQDALKVKAAETKVNFPSRHDWDSFFRDAKNMNEMMPGERPDTVHLSSLPIKWFCDSCHPSSDQPSPALVHEVFGSLGELRALDIPMLDQMQKDDRKTLGIQTFSFSRDLTFEVFVQFKEYVTFVKAMDALRGKKLLYKAPDGKASVASIKVDFDKTKHLSARNIRRRQFQRELLVELEREKEERVISDRMEEERYREDERKKRVEGDLKKAEKRLRSEAYQKKKAEAKRKALHKRKLLILRRRKESKALLKDIFESVRVQDWKEKVAAIEVERFHQAELEERQRLAELNRQEDLERARQDNLLKQEDRLREKLLLNLKVREERRTEQLREKLRDEIAGRNLLKSVLVPTAKPIQLSPDRHGSPSLKSSYQFPKPLGKNRNRSRPYNGQQKQQRERNWQRTKHSPVRFVS